MKKVTSARDILRKVGSEADLTTSVPPSFPSPSFSRSSLSRRHNSSQELSLLESRDDATLRLQEKIAGSIQRIFLHWIDSLALPVIELPSVHRLELYALSLAEVQACQSVSINGSASHALHPSFKESGLKLQSLYKELASAIVSKEIITPAAECFVDNFHLVLAQVSIVRKDLPASFYKELPLLNEGVFKNFPRVYAIALVMISCLDSLVSRDALLRFLHAFQQRCPLNIGELWAVPINLRVVLIEQLRSLASRLNHTRSVKQRANDLADHLLSMASIASISSVDLVQLLSKSFQSAKDFDRALVVQLVQRLRDQNRLTMPAFEWLDRQLQKRFNTTSEMLIQSEHSSQAADQVTIQNIISSFRQLEQIDWMILIENVSMMEHKLEQDPAGVFSRMSSVTRDEYRHAVERLAKRSGKTELEVSNMAIEMAQAHSDQRNGHVGYWLIDDGLSDLERALNYQHTRREKVYNWVRANNTAFYLCSLVALTLIFMTPALFYAMSASDSSLRSIWYLIALFCLLFLPHSDLAHNFLDHTITLLIKPMPRAAMNMTEGIKADARAMVVIPMLFSNTAAIDDVTSRLEVHFLSNQDENLWFALLSDFVDSSVQETEQDMQLYAYAQNAIAELNNKYMARRRRTSSAEKSKGRLDDAPAGPDRFWLFHRRRAFNPAEGDHGMWMGWERKRGKLHELNALLRGSTSTSYYPTTASSEFLATIRFVITLDADTSLPREAARRLIGIATHPLNVPVVDPRTKMTVKGYGILQPRVTVALESTLVSRFSLLFSNWEGIDQYESSVSSDVYQDLFRSGPFHGKGLYVVDAFLETALDRTPDNAILSHDLYESLFVRSCLVSEIEIYDEIPSTFNSWASRDHRWIRGDWQLLPMLLPRVKNEHGTWVTNPLPIISRWKVFDNLRRSLTQPSILLWLVSALTCLPGSPLHWVMIVFVVAWFFPFYTLLLSVVLQVGVTATPWLVFFSSALKEFKLKLAHLVFNVSLLVELAFMNLDAIARSLWRICISRRNLLEWRTAAQVEMMQAQARHPTMQMGPIAAAAITALTLISRPWLSVDACIAASPFALLWLTSPWLKTYIRTSPTLPPVLSDQDRLDYRRYARLTWHFFTLYVGESTHWLAPDNVQFEPTHNIAYRTSPTNIGLQLISIISAREFGYIGHLESLELIEKVFVSLLSMERFNGHFFNWTDISNLEPLKPRYVSQVDSGNLAAALLALKQAMLEAFSVRSCQVSAKNGMTDTLRLLADEIQAIMSSRAMSTGHATRHLSDVVASMLDELEKMTDPAKFNSASLSSSLQIANDLMSALTLEPKSAETFSSARTWLNAAIRSNEQLQLDLATLEMKATKYLERCSQIASSCQRLFEDMDFSFLFDRDRKLFAIGWLVEDHRIDSYCYDLLASESRLTSLLAIAKGDVTTDHWFHLSRACVPVSGSQALVSWTGSCFEYLMPLLLARSYPNSLLDQTYSAVVACQQEYGQLSGVPYGISESANNARDLDLNYQYGPQGIAGLGLKRGLANELVISPYSSFLMAMVDPISIIQNLRELEHSGMLSKEACGFYEAVDYTSKRLPANQDKAIIKSVMAHHQGMSLVAMNNVLNAGKMQDLFHLDPLIKSVVMLLQERVLINPSVAMSRADELLFEGRFSFSVTANPRIYSNPSLETPRTQLLSNGQYSVMITSAGSGFSRCNGLAVTRWREDTTRDQYGCFIYLRDRSSEFVWSAAYQPLCEMAAPESLEVVLAEDHVEIHRLDQGITTKTEIVVATRDNAELRHVSLTNNGNTSRTIELTSFFEVVLAPPADDDAHTTFSNLFVQTEWLSATNCLLASRRPRSSDKPWHFAFHAVAIDGHEQGELNYETDRARFIGRGRNASSPIALTPSVLELSNSVGAVLDPCMALRQVVVIPADSTVIATFSLGYAASREEAMRMAEKFQDNQSFKRQQSLAWTQCQVQLRHLDIDTDLAHIFQSLAGRVIYCDSSLRAPSYLIASSTRVQSNLWAYGISGDFPIILVCINDIKDISIVRDFFHCHEYLRLRGLSVDLVVLNERSVSYIQLLQEELTRVLSSSPSAAMADKRGGVFIRRGDIMPKEDVVLLKAIARVYLRAEQGSLAEQVRRQPVSRHQLSLPSIANSSRSISRLEPNSSPAASPTRSQSIATRASSHPVPVLPMHELYRALSASQTRFSSDLLFFNGLGGFSRDGKEYVIALTGDQLAPMPWINVVANANDFGFIVSEAGAGYSWSMNSRENRLTPWSNDPLTDSLGEALFLRDETSGIVWSPTPLPIRESERYIVRHGHGYSSFEHSSHDIKQHLVMFVPKAQAESSGSGVKLFDLTLTNLSSQTRQLTLTCFFELVLGVLRPNSAPTIVTSLDRESSALLALNSYNNEFASRVAFVNMISTNPDDSRSFTCDRREFIGRNRSVSDPLAMGSSNVRLSGACGAALDPCAAIRTAFLLGPGETRRFVVQLGEAGDLKAARQLMQRYSSIKQVEEALNVVTDDWEHILGGIVIQTPDEKLNMLTNRWLIYQTLSCRMWARSAFYQSGGAIGMRDQLQDSMAVIYSRPDLTRAQIIRAASKVFKEGDAMHWWHEPTGRGVRTRCSDDALFLPYVLSFYIKVTGDVTILTEMQTYVKAPLLRPEQEDSYMQPEIDASEESILDHAIRVADRHLDLFGAHGLPLIGGMDWNDGMNLIGAKGKGESVWLAFFMYKTFDEFSTLCDQHGKSDRASAYRARMTLLKEATEKEAWDGAWFKRAFFDDGTPLGSSVNQECCIDGIAQSWAVISGACDPARAVQAMHSAEEKLIQRGGNLIRLFTPPFDKGILNPGYIQAYNPGMRENGAQYTHAAAWFIFAVALMGDGDKACELFSMINPINHSLTRAGVQRYKVEPYAMAADVYSLPPHVGRGGWSQYTGSSAWMYRVAIEAILGFHLHGDELTLVPNIPSQWPAFKIIYRHYQSTYTITVTNRAKSSVADEREHPVVPPCQAVYELDGQVQAESKITLTRAMGSHTVRIQL